MKLWSSSRRAGTLLVPCLLLAFAAAEAQAKLIHLRNQLISTAPERSPKLVSRSQPAPPISGLYLIQFTGPLEVSARTQLAQAGIDLLHYVPDDAFVARFHDVQLDLLSRLPFVEWVGPYGPNSRSTRGFRDRPRPGSRASR